VLIVDDSEVQVTLLTRAMHDDGYECVAETSSDCAFDTAASVLPDVVLLDVEMPTVNGFAVCRQLKERGGDTADPGADDDRSTGSLSGRARGRRG
jgi:CheY-like chemotaxis protein